MAKSKQTIDLHPIAKNGQAIDAALSNAIEEAQSKKLSAIEIIPGKGTGQLKKRVLKFLQRKDIKVQYDRLQVDAKNHGRIFVYFRHS